MIILQILNARQIQLHYVKQWFKQNDLDVAPEKQHFVVSIESTMEYTVQTFLVKLNLIFTTKLLLSLCFWAELEIFALFHPHFYSFYLSLASIFLLSVGSIKPNLLLSSLNTRVMSLQGPSSSYCACGRHSFFWRTAAAVASRWQQCVRFNRPIFKPRTSRSRDERVTVQPTGRFQLYLVIYSMSLYLWKVGI